jgi:GNAT superfamily N-acetyltransferase
MARGPRPDRRYRGCRALLDEHYDTEAFRSLIDDETVLLDLAATDRPSEGSSATFDLGRLYVDPDRWEAGIGRRLLEHMERVVRRRGGTRIELGVMAENDRAIGFYEADGYDRIHAFDDGRIDARGTPTRKTSRDPGDRSDGYD